MAYAMNIVFWLLGLFFWGGSEGAETWTITFP